MSSSKKRLGRGLAHLLGDDALESLDPQAPAQAQPSRSGLQHLGLDQLEPSPFQPRQDFDEIALQELAQSLKNTGLVQPLLVRPHGQGYQIIAGERRWRAAQMAGLHDIPAYIRELDDQACLEAGLIENTQRQDLNPIEEARAYKRLIDDFDYTATRLAEQLGKSRPYVANLIRLLDLPDEVLQLVEGGALTAGHARALIGYPHAVELAVHAMDNDLSVRQVEALVQRGWHPAKGSEKAQRAPKDPDIEAVRVQLQEHLGLKVDLSHRQGKGRVVIHFRDADQFDALMTKLSH